MAIFGCNGFRLPPNHGRPRATAVAGSRRGRSDSICTPARGIAVRYHEYEDPPYPQRFGELVPNLSYLDRMFKARLDREAVLAGGRMLEALTAALIVAGS
jgi:hypothetical protein